VNGSDMGDGLFHGSAIGHGFAQHHELVPAVPGDGQLLTDLLDLQAPGRHRRVHPHPTRSGSQRSGERCHFPWRIASMHWGGGGLLRPVGPSRCDEEEARVASAHVGQVLLRDHVPSSTGGGRSGQCGRRVVVADQSEVLAGEPIDGLEDRHAFSCTARMPEGRLATGVPVSRTRSKQVRRVQVASVDPVDRCAGAPESETGRACRVSPGSVRLVG
jgi:hypothetical protein